VNVPAAGITFRFGLTGRRWGDWGPVVLLLNGRDDEPASFARLIEPLLAAGRQVIALDDPTSDDIGDEPLRVAEFAAAIGEAAVEMRELESVVGHGRGAAAAAQALTQGLSAERAVLLGSTGEVDADDILDSLLDPQPEQEPLRRAA
jgi:pimeloyl-ACP methyl ester carboxylesterase